MRRAYVDQAAVSYSFYVVGASAAFIALALSLSETEAGLHSSAMAVGMIVAGVAGERFDGLAGVRPMHYLAMGLLAVSLVLLAWAPAVTVTLAASLGVGLGAGVMFGHLTHTLGAGGGPVARLRLTRAAFVAKASQLMAPVAIAIGAVVGLEWQFVIVPVLVLLAALLVWSRSAGEATVVRGELGRLPRAYWLPWLLTVMVIGLEFFVVVWGGSLVAARTGESLADATLTISAFIAGMIAGRAVMSMEATGRFEAMRIIRGGLVVTFVAVLAIWVSGSWWLSAGAMAVAGFGVGHPLSAVRGHHAGDGARGTGGGFITSRACGRAGHPGGAVAARCHRGRQRHRIGLVAGAGRVHRGGAADGAGGPGATSEGRRLGHSVLSAAQATAAANELNRSPGSGVCKRQITAMGCSPTWFTYVPGPRNQNARSPCCSLANNMIEVPWWIWC